MPSIDKATGRVVAVVVLLVVAGIALRGYLPPAAREPAEETTSSPGSSIAVLALLIVSLSIVVFAALTSRRTAPRPAAVHEAPASLRRELGRPGWRILLIGLGALLAWLLLVMVLSRFNVPLPMDDPEAARPASPTTPRDAPATAPEEMPEPPPEQSGDAFIYLAVATVVMVLLIAVGAVLDARRKWLARPHNTPVDNRFRAEPAKPASESLARAAELGLAEIGDLSREPREAIIACYAAMERALANAPGAVPQDSDTPSEVLARAVEHHALHADSATELVDLFAEARFSPHVMNEGHRDVAVRVLERVLTELRSVA
ncbi:DUF4129 domain-containing protein [Mycobacterium hubeiense]|uniref:DUF4129 domain-containing protein n=1 Tax=Mycobacterium hubeiense TaxID=1867256 RepID=UPI000C7F5C51|nr:DUF4129 domain-containing protein [Mycobacterium sp. QGD 101]